MSSTKILPCTQTTYTTVCSFKVTCRSLNLFDSASFIVDTLDVNGGLILRQVLTMDQPTYLEWNNNDSFVAKWVASQLGFVIEP